ncbi:MAG: type II toxin-antitoxin system VapC family toxin [Spirochaetales bacterium]
MNILLDTHIFLWALAEPDRLSEDRRHTIQTRANRVLVSSISVTEIIINASIGKLELSFDPAEMIESSGFEPAAYRVIDAMQLASLPRHHRDPFDRMLIAQAIANDWKLMTDDSAIHRYDVAVL